jgi:hypothetical protein
MVHPMARTEHRPGATILAVVLAVLVGCGGGGGPSAEKIALRWRQALEKGDYETTWDLEGPNMRAPAGKAVDIATRQKDRFGQPLSPERAAVSIKALRMASDPDHPGDVWVYLQVNTKDTAQSHQEAVGVSKIGGSWRVQRREPFVSPVRP